MKILLEIIEKKYNRLINDFQLLKEILYLISKEEREKIKQWMNSEIEKEIIKSHLEPNVQPTSTTDTLTFLKNLIKDGK